MQDKARHFSIGLVLSATSVRELGEVKIQRTDAHDHQETRAEASKIQNSGTGALDKVIWVCAVAAYPVRHRRQHVGGYDDEGVVRMPQGAREDDEEESNGKDEGEGDDGLQACGRHLDVWTAGEVSECGGVGLFGIGRAGSCGRNGSRARDPTVRSIAAVGLWVRI